MEYYVYAHLNPVTLKPFYIGKGKDGRVNDIKSRGRFWKRVYNKYGFAPIKLVEGLTNDQACEIEKQYISRYGFLRAGGILINHTKGGDGGNTFDPVNGKNWNSGRTGIYSEETINKFRLSRLGKKLSPETKEKVLAGLKKATEASLKSRTHKIQCLVTGKIWEGRQDCIKDLGITLMCYKLRIIYNRPIKGYHLQLIK